MPTNYSRGEAFERRVKKDLESKGYFVVRSAGSKGPVDLVCFVGSMHLTSVVWLIQCKRDKRLPKKEREAMRELARKYTVCPILAYMPGKRGIAYEEVG